MRPGPAALCVGSVWHRRHTPAAHEFRYPVSQVWIDPDRPNELCDLSRWWSATGPAPVRFRAADYGTALDRSGASGDDGGGGDGDGDGGGGDGDGDAGNNADEPPSLGRQVRDDLAPVLGRRPAGPVRMVSQLRRWGWLFNPITFFLAWDDPGERPIGAVLEVTNTPWHERHRYPVALAGDDDRWRATFAKTLHVSPFLDEDFHYQFAIDDRDDRFRAALDVVTGDGDVVVSTVLDTGRETADRASVRAATLRPLLPTHRVTIGIHAQAARLWRKGVPFVAHPDKRQPQPETTRS